MLKMFVFFAIVWFVVFCITEAASSVKDIRTVKHLAKSAAKAFAITSVAAIIVASIVYLF